MSEFLTYPKEIQKIFLFEQKRQTGRKNVSIFIKKYAATQIGGGFSWSKTLYSVKLHNTSIFRHTVSLRERRIYSFEAMIDFYKQYIPDLAGESTETIEVDGITVIL